MSNSSMDKEMQQYVAEESLQEEKKYNNKEGRQADIRRGTGRHSGCCIAVKTCGGVKIYISGEVHAHITGRL